MFSSVVWSLLILSRTFWVVASNDVSQESNECPRECQCTTTSQFFMSCGFEGSLTTIPSFIPLKVEFLSLYKNMVTEIPESALRNLTNLMTLNLRSNKLRDFPATVFRDLVKLRSFNAGLNKLSSLPGRLFHGLKDLQQIYLDNNAIESIPDELFQDLPSLKQLDLHRNKLKTFPGNAFRGSFSLQVLSLANNHLTSIREGTFRYQTSLKTLKLRDNRIVNISINVFRDLKELRTLRIQNNNISSIPERAFTGLKKGVEVYLSGNPFHCGCELRWLKVWLRSNSKYIPSSASRTTCSKPDHLKGRSIFRVADETYSCVDGQWTEWSPWSSCDSTCGSGARASTRRCTNPPPGRGGKKCKGEDTKIRSCNGPACRASWTAWSEWSPCSKTCSTGKEISTRSCRHSLTGLTSNICKGSPQKTRICTRRPCRVDGEWGPWSPCSATCSWGTRVRIRTCDHPQGQYSGQPCLGRRIAREGCYLGFCPVHGGWSAWSSWSSCSTSCSGGVRTRNRTCSNPLPQYGGKTCGGDSTQKYQCNIEPCPIHGGWTAWSSWSSCSTSCSGGITTRNRTCSNPLPQYGGKTCGGDSTQRQQCNTEPCLIHGGWTAWSTWSHCSVTCSRGSQVRFRTCSDPTPQHGGQNCSGNSSDIKYCELRPCPIHGNWTTWSQWSDCSKTCANGTRSRNRTCSSPFPQFGGRNCSGEVTEITSCIIAPCPIPGNWAAWSQWSECSKSCSSGTKSRIRTCSNPAPSNRGQPCTGNTSEIEWCQEIPCPIDGGWSEWSNWTDCTKTCGNSTKSRYRTCNNPPSQHGGKHCPGDSRQTKYCSQQPCSIHGEWSEWSNWTDCSKTCDIGHQTRTRQCRTPSLKTVARESVVFCTGNETEMRACLQGPCSNQGTWNEWSNWTQCSVSCGLGKQQRFRNCSRNGDLSTDGCQGSEVQVKTCYENECPVNGGWSDWSNWTPCSSSCGTGGQVKFRFCTNPKPQAGGDSCQGKNIMFKSCLVKQCEKERHQNDSFWSSWTSWSHCSTTCSKGHQTRSRYCRRRLSPFHLGNCTGANEGPVQVESNICEVKPCAIWSSWSQWEACSQTCGGGTQKRVRKCKSLIGGMTCKGENSQVVSCNSDPCPTIPPITYLPKITLGTPSLCPDPEKPQNGYYKKIEQYGSYYVTYHCRRHYYVHGPRLRHCESDGIWSDDVPFCLPICGVSSSSYDNVQHSRLRIFGGGTAVPGQWPWQVALMVDDRFHCGGSLIAENWVVTAAHCVYHRQTRKLYSHIKIHLGVHNIKYGLKDPQVQSTDSMEIVPHPNFSWRTFDSDLALIKLRWKANMTDHVRPVCLPSRQQRHKVTPGTMGVMLGWGLTDGEKNTTELQQVDMPVVAHSNCQKAYKSETWPVTSNMLCAGYASNHKDSCKRDSGGGFIFRDSKGKKKKWFLGGIISWGNPQCGIPGKYSVFTHINGRFSRWIKNHVFY